MRIFSKLLSNRMAPLMVDLIDDKQDTFTKGCSTLDYFMMVSETINSCSQLDQNICVIKFDFERAFDTINWGFIEQLLHAHGFPDNWTSVILQLLKIATYSLLIHGEPGRPFQHKHGIRQGNPLSPLLFNLVANVISRLIEKANANLNGLFRDAKMLNEAREIVGWDINFSNFVPLSEVMELAKDLEETLHCSGEDMVEWKWNSSGVFSTSSLYKLLNFPWFEGF
ncbi:hypothetical protein Cni_G26190 [Canna indica]|uniref:Reverse transcriptase domain-containing protein n=1 Tax=Canna indica TaxID=4628 RepID=A0AAQ3QQ15_9LILI|nr:hypothetical protein Cni_G26190 [Canna indica]